MDTTFGEAFLSTTIINGQPIQSKNLVSRNSPQRDSYTRGKTYVHRCTWLHHRIGKIEQMKQNKISIIK